MYLNSSTYESIETDVYELIEDFDLTEYPLSLKRVCEKIQIRLRPYSSLSQEARSIAKEFSNDAFHVGGDYRRMGGTTILYNDAQNICRARYSIAHEIGHVARNLHGDSGLVEGEAEYYAGYLLAPDPLVYAHCPDLAIPSIISKFGISEHAAKVTRDHVMNRIGCHKPWRSYEYGIVRICSVEGVKRTLDELPINGR